MVEVRLSNVCFSISISHNAARFTDADLRGLRTMTLKANVRRWVIERSQDDTCVFS